MATTTKRADYLGRALVNETPGTSDATDYLGRAVITGNKDYAGRALLDKPLYPPIAWAADTEYEVGDRVSLEDGEILEATEDGTSDAEEAPTAPAVGATVEDGTVTWRRIA
jgi:hypothetical protein